MVKVQLKSSQNLIFNLFHVTPEDTFSCFDDFDALQQGYGVHFDLRIRFSFLVTVCWC